MLMKLVEEKNILKFYLIVFEVSSLCRQTHIKAILQSLSYSAENRCESCNYLRDPLFQVVDIIDRYVVHILFHKTLEVKVQRNKITSSWRLFLPPICRSLLYLQQLYQKQILRNLLFRLVLMAYLSNFFFEVIAIQLHHELIDVLYIFGYPWHLPLCIYFLYLVLYRLINFIALEANFDKLHRLGLNVNFCAQLIHKLGCLAYK